MSGIKEAALWPARERGSTLTKIYGTKGNQVKRKEKKWERKKGEKKRGRSKKRIILQWTKDLPIKLRLTEWERDRKKAEGRGERE